MKPFRSCSTVIPTSSCLDCILSDREVSISLALLQCLERLFVLYSYESVSAYGCRGITRSHFCQSSSDCPGLLRPQIKRKILLVFVVFAQILTGLVVHYCQDPRN